MVKRSGPMPKANVVVPGVVGAGAATGWPVVLPNPPGVVPKVDPAPNRALELE